MKELNNLVNEVISLLKQHTAPNEKTKTLWNALNEQAKQEGTWDKDLIDSIDNKIKTQLNNYKENELRIMWESTEKGLESFEDRDAIPLKTVNADIADEILNRVMDKLSFGNEYDDDLAGTEYVNEEDDFEDDFEIEDPEGLDDDIFDEDSTF